MGLIPLVVQVICGSSFNWDISKSPRGSTLKWSKNLDDLRYPHFRKPPYLDDFDHDLMTLRRHVTGMIVRSSRCQYFRLAKYENLLSCNPRVSRCMEIAVIPRVKGEDLLKWIEFPGNLKDQSKHNGVDTGTADGS